MVAKIFEWIFVIAITGFAIMFVGMAIMFFLLGLSRSH